MKAKTPMSAPGNRKGGLLERAAGFTLLELLLVLAIIAMAGGGVGFALRDLGQTQLEREAQRLIAMLESARARSRASGMPVYWRTTEGGFEFLGLAGDAATEDGTGNGTNRDFPPAQPWLAEGMSVPGAGVLTLGPEPIIARQEIVLRQAESAVRIGTDGLRPFALLSAPRAAAQGSDP